jgi:hypothetical protein
MPGVDRRAHRQSALLEASSVIDKTKRPAQIARAVLFLTGSNQLFGQLAQLAQWPALSESPIVCWTPV